MQTFLFRCLFLKSISGEAASCLPGETRCFRLGEKEADRPEQTEPEPSDSLPFETRRRRPIDAERLPELFCAIKRFLSSKEYSTPIL